MYWFERFEEEDEYPPKTIPIPKEKDKDNKGDNRTNWNPDNIIYLPESGVKKPKDNDVAAMTPKKEADLIAYYLIGAGATTATVIYMEKYTSVKPISITTAYLAGEISAMDYCIIMSPLFYPETCAAAEPDNDKINHAAGSSVGEVEDHLDAAGKARQSDPLVINLDITGIETISVDQGVYFDHMGNGFKIKTGWVTGNNGFLARDLNGNGKIDDGTELFGDRTRMKNGQYAINGFEALKDLCEREDGIFDENSVAFSELYIWVDHNGNGKTDSDELILLSETNIISIDTNYFESDFADSHGNTYKQVSTATLADGEIVEVADIWFERKVKDSQAVDRTEVSDEMKALPQIRGFGTTHSLQQAMMLDSSGQLRSLVEQFVEEKNETVRKNLVPQIIYKWTSKTTKLEAMEAMTGTKYTGGTHSNAVLVINKGFDNFSHTIYEILMSQSHYQYLY